MLNLILYSKPGCHLCEQVKEYLRELQAQYPHELMEIDIESDAQLHERYALEIPVLKVGPYTLKAPIREEEIRIALAAASDHKKYLDNLGVETDAYIKNRTWGLADQIVYWVAQHYLEVINGIVMLYVSLPFLAPVLMKVHLEPPARLIYGLYSVVCHQLAYRSFFLFGEQLVYPREAAGLEGLKSYSQATGLPEGSSAETILRARQFVGNEQVGYKVALCQRDVAIYLGILSFGLLFLFYRKIRSIPWFLWVLFGLVPIGLDGVTQIISQPPLSLLPFRESTPYLRVLTGFGFGFFTAWFGFPSVEESMAETRRTLHAKRMRLLSRA
ncbi:MAG: glutaredoxin family protein [Anaerolineales bacterium]|nr:glutaredoxin family protein [Anaerolineales bacterium]MDW8162760.1 glutaredoxin family protein [Anaerolineales bacterium]